MQVDKISREYHVKSYECDRNGTLRLLTLMNIFQDTADTHASLLGVGIEHCLAHGLAWVGSNYQIEIERMPAWHEKITVESWPAAEKKLGAVRDFVIRDEKGTPIIRAFDRLCQKKTGLAARQPAAIPGYRRTRAGNRFCPAAGTGKRRPS